jgi:hypothetical protein
VQLYKQVYEGEGRPTRFQRFQADSAIAGHGLQWPVALERQPL